MQYTVDGAGEHCFTARVSVQSGLEYQYRFRAAESDDWLLDEHSSIVTDHRGNKTNLLKAPAMDRAPKQRQSSPEVPQRAIESVPVPGLPGTMSGASAQGKPGAASAADATNGARSRTPTEVVSSTAAEVADTAAQFDDPKNTMPSRPEKLQDTGDATGDHEDFKSPLFAHEAFGASETADDGFDHEPQDFAVNSPNSRLSFGNYGFLTHCAGSSPATMTTTLIWSISSYPLGLRH
ncbi:hypothetical protein HRG_005542 [Hirsutella rhossiliensis]|uniref:AMP-activated protein kinase glycogen-binding domain-containing protein n=1 Tax=Hirsutella rhossiliensis TaxID=111463 RepID=A0A9P8MXA7_9HYPO|nr:uncharacterized protein HRG_05542 [Hirsutella rhossiliensis]KAH0963032.1 hypothetical protein HRG_05542 [Hirsutella rhossiliensis]